MQLFRLKFGACALLVLVLVATVFIPATSRAQAPPVRLIVTAAGGGVGDGGPATAAVLYPSSGVASDGVGNVYISDTGDNRIRKVSGGVITTFAGNGGCGQGGDGDGGAATSARMCQPGGIALGVDGSLYIAQNGRVRKVASGIISTVAGGGVNNGDGGLATMASLGTLSAVRLIPAATCTSLISRRVSCARS